MTKEFKIGVVGCGYVGSAVAAGFSLHVSSVKMYDRYKPDDYDSAEDTINNSDIIFVCVPTPTKESGEQDLSAIHDVLLLINKLALDPKIIVIKSTVLPGTCRMYSEAFKWHSIVYNPEFLSARTARFDFINPARIILGGELGSTKTVAELYVARFGRIVPIWRVKWETAELVKYTANTFFATKIAFCNEIYKLTEKLEVDYDEVKTLWLADGKIAPSHCDVPGHDGKLGYGGACFPKDVKAFIHWANKENLEVEILEAVHNSNSKLRGEPENES